MDYFKYKNSSLYCEGVSVKKIAKKYDTPLFIYSQKTILEHFSKLKEAFSQIKPLICYSVKANSNLSILKLLVKAGAGLDIVSGGELYRAKKIKCHSEKIVYASVGKTEEEIKEAIAEDIFMFNVESTNELKRIDKIAKKSGKKVRVSLRLNPDVESKTHKYITTGKKETKFGIDKKSAREIFLGADKYKNVIIAGIHLHIGSQITESFPFISALKKTKEFLAAIPASKNLEFLNIGGGLGIVYKDEQPQTAKEFAKNTLPLLKTIGLKVILEPGRFIIGNAGILVTKVLYNKESYNKGFIVVDAAMNDFLRPSLYNAYHKIITVDENKNKLFQKNKLVDIVGPVCESGDFLGKKRKISADEGDYLAVFGAGAYGTSMSSNYNSRRRAPEVLINNKRCYRIKKRESYQDLIKQEIII
ncbi:MAG: diaminopimelate decarboxylase [Candidatus Omnitrophica bacterium]|nr:diaminopimelate decarboxylase [Candidatus Omnitrophota bacterium]MCF7894192.1 diaminopimelate decarboxylase [Candidatus Omnitrophota bacterium]